MYMPSQEDITQQQELLSIYRRTLALLLMQQARAGGEAHMPPLVMNGVRDARENIGRIKRILRNWGVVITDHPDDGLPIQADPDDMPPALVSPPQRPPAVEPTPFGAGPPVAHPRLFFGRERELRRLFNLWQRPPLQNAAIVGPRRAGKTSLLLHLALITTTPPEQLRLGQRFDYLPAPERYRWVFVDFQDPRLGRREGLLRYILACLELPAPDRCDLERFLEVVSCGLQTPTVVLLDEVGVALQRYSELDDGFWEGLRALATTQVGGNLGFVLATHESPIQLAQNHGHSSPFFNIFGYTARLGPLVDAEARALIADSPIAFPDTDIDWILAQSGRWPILLNILCRERLVMLEEGEAGDGWREDAMWQIEPFRYLLG